MNKISNHGFANLLFIIVVLLGIAVGVFLATRPTVFIPKASETPSLTRAYSGPYQSTPISDLDLYPTPINHIQTFIHLAFPTLGSFTDYDNFITKRLDYLHVDPGRGYVIGGPTVSESDCTGTDFSPLVSKINSLKTASPNLKVALYVGGGYGPDCHHLFYPYLGSNDILYHLDRTPISIVNEANGGSGHIRKLKVIDMSTQTNRDRLADKWTTAYTTNNLDGIFVDGYDYAYISNSFLHDAINLPGCKNASGTTVDCLNWQYWADNESAYTKTILAKNPGKDIFINGIDYIDNWPSDSQNIPYFKFVGQLHEKLAEDATGVFAETFSRVILDENKFATYLRIITNLVEQPNPKKIFIWIQPKFLFFHNYDYTIPPPVDDYNYGSGVKDALDLERFFLATYLLLQRNPYTYFGYNPGTPYQAVVDGPFFYKDWNLNYGNPVGGYSTLGSLYYRAYENGVAVVNPTHTDATFPLAQGQNYRLWDPCNPNDVTNSVAVPAKTGQFYFYTGKIACTAPYVQPPSDTSPTIITNLTTQTGTLVMYPGKHTVNWNPVPGASSYKLILDNQTLSPNSFTACTQPDPESGDDCANLQTNLYEVQLRINNSYTLQIQPLDSQDKPVGNLLSVNVVVAGMIINQQGSAPCENGVPVFNLTWTNPTSTDQNYLFRSDGKVIPVTTLGQAKDTDLQPSKTYSYEIFSHNPLIKNDVSGNDLGPGWSPAANLLVTSAVCALPTPNPSPSPTITSTPTQTPSAVPSPTATPTSTPQPTTKIGDITGNDKVDVFDLSVLLSNYGRKSTDPDFNPKADLKKDDLINVFDLSILLSHYGS